ncbi:hypothetical protein FRB94_010487 [Tulasnella sp. JGI-2019a]|nr:hypothetical protein FRB94_010487 [Tulasnella sp. JGI-2019a]
MSRSTPAKALSGTITDEPASGAHKLHDDMLYEIFIAATSDEHVVKAFTAREAEIITQVCRRWKTIAEHSPQLWTLVHIDTRYTPSRTARWLSLGRQMGWQSDGNYPGCDPVRMCGAASRCSNQKHRVSAHFLRGRPTHRAACNP